MGVDFLNGFGGQLILVIVGALVSALLTVILRKLGITQRIAQNASDKADNAAHQAIATRDASEQTNVDVSNLLAEVEVLKSELAEARVDLIEATQAAAEQRDSIRRFADNQDTLLTAHLRAVTYIDRLRLPERMTRSEGWMQRVSNGNGIPGPIDEPLPSAGQPLDEADDALVTTGRHRFPTRAVPTIQQEQQ